MREPTAENGKPDGGWPAADALGHYLDALFGAEPSGGLIEVRYRTPSESMGQLWHAVEGRRSIIDCVLSLGAETDAYIGVAPRRARQGGRESIKHVHALWADCDAPASVEALRAFRPLPAMVFASGTPGHFHAYWPLSPAVTPEEAEKANRRLAHHLGADMGCTDAARILRPPGTHNHKKDPPVLVDTFQLNPETFRIDEVVGNLPSAPSERPRERNEAAPMADDDPLKAIAPAVYIEALTGREIGRDGKVACPFHEDRTPSLHAYPTPERGWCCHGGCGGGTIIDFGAKLYGLEPRGDGYREIRERLDEDLLSAGVSVGSTVAERSQHQGNGAHNGPAAARRDKPDAEASDFSEAATPSRDQGGEGTEHWLESAAQLLGEPDPEPTPYLVEHLVVDGAVAAVQGSHKVGKTWLLLEVARAVVTGRPALGHFNVERPGPVILVLEESGRTALHRRLDALCRGSGTDPENLAGLHFAANRRVRLDDAGWRTALLDAGRAIRPRAIVLDPLVRLKGAQVDEDSQREMAQVLDFMRELRDESGAAVIWAHHTGHGGQRLRGTSDLEAYWESKVTVVRDKGICTLSSEHREAEGGPTLDYRLAWHDASRSMRLELINPPERSRTLREELVEYVEQHPGENAEAIAAGLQKRSGNVRQTLRDGEADGLVIRRPSEYRDALGRPRTREGWYSASREASLPVPSDGTGWDGERDGASEAPRPAGGRPPIGGAPRDGEPGLGSEAGT